MPYADVSQYVLASEAIPEIARCYFGGDTSKAESDARIAAQEGALPVFLGSLFLQYIRRDRWYHDHIHWSSINEPLYFPRANLLKIYPNLWRSLQSPNNETTLVAVPEGAPDSDTAQSDAIDVDTSGSDRTDAEIDFPQGDAREAEQGAPDDADTRKSKSARPQRGNPNWVRGSFYLPLKNCLRSKAKVLKKNGKTLRDWFEGLSRSEFRDEVKPALEGIKLPTDRHLYDTGKKIIAEIEKR